MKSLREQIENLQSKTSLLSEEMKEKNTLSKIHLMGSPLEMTLNGIKVGLFFEKTKH